MEELLLWGNGAGCGPLKDNPLASCSNIPGTCKATGSICSNDYLSYGDCSSDHTNQDYRSGFSGECSVFKEMTDCRFNSGFGKRCIDVENAASARQAICGQVVCTRLSGLTEAYDVTIKLPSGDVQCGSGDTNTAKTIPSSTAKVVCPNTLNLCRTGAMCPKDCSNNGRCKLDGLCWCYPSHTGANCATINPSPYQMMIINPSSSTIMMVFTIAVLLGTLIYF